MGDEKDQVGPAHTAANDSRAKVLSTAAAKVKETVSSHAANAAAKVKETVSSHAANAAAVASDACSKLHDSTVAKVKETVRCLSDPNLRDNVSKFAVNATINAAKHIPGGVGIVVDVVAQSIPQPQPEKVNPDKEYTKRVKALEDEVKELKKNRDSNLNNSPTSKL